MRLCLVGMLVLSACSSADRVDTAFAQLDGALPSQLRQVSEDSDAGHHAARYEARGEPAEVASLVRSSLVAHGFTLFAGSGLPEPLPGSTEPPAVDAVQISGFRGKGDKAMMRSLSFYAGPRPGSTVVVATADVQD